MSLLFLSMETCADCDDGSFDGAEGLIGKENKGQREGGRERRGESKKEKKLKPPPSNKQSWTPFALCLYLHGASSDLEFISELKKK